MLLSGGALPGVCGAWLLLSQVPFGQPWHCLDCANADPAAAQLSLGASAGVSVQTG